MEKIVKYNAQTNGREKLIRLCQYTTKLVASILSEYHKHYPKGGVKLLELLYKLRELEQYFVSCRRLISFGRAADQLYLAFRSMRLDDPIVRLTSAASKFWLSLQLFADHILWLDQIGLLRKYDDKQVWVDRASRFWLYSVGANLLRDFYELICAVRKGQKSDHDKKYPERVKPNQSRFGTLAKWVGDNPKLSCDLIKNLSDIWIPFMAVNKIQMHSGVISTLGILSTSMGILQAYDRDYRLSAT